LDAVLRGIEIHVPVKFAHGEIRRRSARAKLCMRRIFP
jgi:hypothetical protein